MLNSGDIVGVDLDTPVGSEAGLRRPAIVVTADGVLRGEPNVVHVVPLTRTIRPSGAEVNIEPDDHNRLSAPSAVQCQHIRSVSATRLIAVTGSIGPVLLAEIREVLGLLLKLLPRHIGAKSARPSASGRARQRPIDSSWRIR